MDLEPRQKPAESTPGDDAVYVSAMVQSGGRLYPTVAVCTLISLAIGFAIMLLSAPVWEVSSSLYFPIRSVSLLSPTSTASQLSAAAGLGGPNVLNVNEQILKSQSVMDYVQSQIHLRRRDIKKKVKITPDLPSNVLVVSVDDQSIPLASRIVRAYTTGLRQVSERLDISPMTQELKLIQDSLVAHTQELKKAQNLLVAFQNGQSAPTSVMASGSGSTSSVLVLPGGWLSQVRSLQLSLLRNQVLTQQAEQHLTTLTNAPLNLPSDIPVASKWRDQLEGQEFQMKMDELTLPPQAPSLQLLRRQMALTKQELRTQVDKYFNAVHLNITDAGLRGLYTERIATQAQLQAVRKLKRLAPREAEHYQTLIREVTVDSGIVDKIKAQLAAAQLEAQVDANNWQILDDARVSEKPVNKSILKTLLIYGLIGVVIGYVVALWRIRPRRYTAVAVQ